MNLSITINETSKENYSIKLQGGDWELNIHIAKGELANLANMRHAIWNNRASIKAGTSAGVCAYWSYDNDSQLVAILIGQDDETWDFAVAVPADTIMNALTPYIQ